MLAVLTMYVSSQRSFRIFLHFFYVNCTKVPIQALNSRKEGYGFQSTLTIPLTAAAYVLVQWEASEFEILER